MDDDVFNIIMCNGHYELYQYGVFKCSGDTKEELECEISDIRNKY